MSEKSITPVLPGDAVPPVGARTTNMCAMPRQAPRHQQLSVLGQMRVMVGDRHQHRSVPGRPCVPPALISSLLVGRRGTHRLEELRAVLTLRITNEMGFQLRFSLPGLPVCGAPADALPVPPTRLRATAWPWVEPAWQLTLHRVMQRLQCPGRGAGTGTGAGTVAGPIAAPLWVAPSPIPMRVLEACVHSRVWRRGRDLSFIPADPLGHPGLPRPLCAHTPVHVASTPAHCHQRHWGGRDRLGCKTPCPLGSGAEGAGARPWWLLSCWQPGSQPWRRRLAGRRALPAPGSAHHAAAVHVAACHYLSWAPALLPPPLGPGHHWSGGLTDHLSLSLGCCPSLLPRTRQRRVREERRPPRLTGVGSKGH